MLTLERPRAATTVADDYPVDVSSTGLDEIDRISDAFGRGDDHALRAAYDAHGALIYSFCRRRLDEARAAEVTQDVFVTAWRKRDQFDSTRGSLAAWLVGIAKNRLIDHVRSERRHDDRRAAVESADVGVEGDVDRIGDRMLVADALSCLPQRSRTVIELAYLQGHTHAEIAERTELPLGTVKSDIRRGLVQIRNHLESADA